MDLKMTMTWAVEVMKSAGWQFVRMSERNNYCFISPAGVECEFYPGHVICKAEAAVVQSNKTTTHFT